jgi:hypothetical protein
MYSTPLMGFIDDACLIFDTEEENKLEYTQIHDQFKQLVDTLISDYLLELGVPPEQFAEVRRGSALTAAGRTQRRHLESKPQAVARLDLEMTAGWASPSSRGLWRGDALLETETLDVA